MFKKILLFTLLFISVFSYQQEDDTLILTGDDFPNVVSEFNYLFVCFDVNRGPATKNIQMLDVYSAVKGSNPKLKVGRINVMEHRKPMELYHVYAFPTFVLFRNGEVIKYDGQEKLQEITNWLRKRVASPVIQIDKKKYDKLYFQNTASIVYHGNFPESNEFQSLNKRALSNVKNNFYWGKDLGSKQGTIQMLRNSNSISYIGKVNQDFDVWFFKYRRGLIIQFTLDTSSQIFGDQQIKGFVLFKRHKDHANILKQMTEAAKAYNKPDVVFGTMDADSSEQKKMSSIFHIDPEQYPLVLYEYKTRSKYLLRQPFTKKTILALLNNPEPYRFSLQRNVTLATQQQARNQDIEAEKQKQELAEKSRAQKQQKERLQKEKLQVEKSKTEQPAKQKAQEKLQQTVQEKTEQNVQQSQLQDESNEEL